MFPYECVTQYHYRRAFRILAGAFENLEMKCPGHFGNKVHTWLLIYLSSYLDVKHILCLNACSNRFLYVRRMWYGLA